MNAEVAQALAPADAGRRLLESERDICWLRESAILAYLIRLVYHDVSPASAWLVGAGTLTYAGIVHWRVLRGTDIRTTAGVATVCDSLVGFFLTYTTGGIGSPFFPLMYFTALTAAFRFGLRVTLAVTALNVLLAVLLYVLLPDQGAEPMGLALYYLGFAAILGATIAGWARRQIALTQEQANALTAAHDEARSLLHRLIRAQEDERQLIAGDLHDRMGGRLFTLQQGIDRCCERVAGDAALAGELHRLADEARRCSQDVRRLMNELRPTVLDDLGLFEALQEYGANLGATVPFELRMDIDPRLRERHSPQDAMLFRLVQEAVLNVRKHAEARHVEIRITLEERHLQILVADDGRGFDPAQVPHGHLGLLTMRERGEALGGEFSVYTAPGRGTRIVARIPT
ncbi:MAG TPA: sensor histidine kinase [Gammaproteobacteria bacterium]|nr:sensor histidine kinase [Gammaproteobacteria bacterium]